MAHGRFEHEDDDEEEHEDEEDTDAGRELLRILRFRRVVKLDRIPRCGGCLRAVGWFSNRDKEWR